MKQPILSLEFATNMFGNLKPDIKARLMAVINNPCQETWDDAHGIIINGSGKMITLWNAIHTVKPNFCHRKPLDAPWEEIPTSEEIIQAIKNVVYKDYDSNKKVSKEVFDSFFRKS
jgi:hypothetical protein